MTRIRAARPALLCLLAAALLLPSCGDGRKKCYPVSGKVLVNGKPVKDVLVLFNPREKDPKGRLAPVAMTDENGEFRLATYAAGDGAPAGEYLVTFTWREASGLLKTTFDGPDRLGGRYQDPKQSQFPVTVEKQPLELPPFQLEN